MIMCVKVIAKDNHKGRKRGNPGNIRERRQGN